MFLRFRRISQNNLYGKMFKEIYGTIDKIAKIHNYLPLKFFVKLFDQLLIQFVVRVLFLLHKWRNLLITSPGLLWDFFVMAKAYLELFRCMLRGESCWVFFKSFLDVARIRDGNRVHRVLSTPLCTWLYTTYVNRKYF